MLSLEEEDKHKKKTISLPPQIDKPFFLHYLSGYERGILNYYRVAAPAPITIKTSWFGPDPFVMSVILVSKLSMSFNCGASPHI